MYTVIYVLHMATLFNNHPHISSRKFSANWRAMATYVEMVVEYCGHACYGVHITVCMALLVYCTLSASAFMH